MTLWLEEHACLQNEGGSKQSSTSCLLHACFLLGLLFNPEDGSNLFPQKLLYFFLLASVLSVILEVR
jgi:hypothetical protein